MDRPPNLRGISRIRPGTRHHRGQTQVATTGQMAPRRRAREGSSATGDRPLDERDHVPGAPHAAGRPGGTDLARLVRGLVVVPVLTLALGSLALVLQYWDRARNAAERELARRADTIAAAVDRQLEAHRARLTTIAASPTIDAQDWAGLHRFAAAALRDQPGTLVALTQPDGAQMLNSGVPFGTPMPNLRTLEQRRETVAWRGRQMQVSSQGLTRWVLEHRQAGYSDLYWGVSVRRPALSMAIPLLRGDTAVGTLTLSFPPQPLQQLLGEFAVAGEGHALVMVDRQQQVIAATPGAGLEIGDLLPASLQPPPDAAERRRATWGTKTALGDMVASVARTGSSGWSVIVVGPRDELLAAAYRGMLAWGFLIAAVFGAVLWNANRLARRLTGPLSRLAAAVPGLQLAQQRPLEPSGIAEVDRLSEALFLAARREELHRADRQRAAAAEQAAAAEAAAMAERAASGERLQRVLDSLSSLVALLGPDGTVVEVNREPLARAGLGREQVIGRPYWECHWWQAEPAVQQRVREAVAMAIEGIPARLDTAMALRDGEATVVDLRIVPLRDADGRITHLVSSGVDIAERLAALESVRDRERRFRTLADGLPLLVWVHDAQGRLSFINETYRRFFGTTDEAVLGGGWQALTHPEDGPAYAAEFARCVAERRDFHATVRVRDGEGRWRRLESWARPNLDAHGGYQGHFGNSADITEQHESRVALEREATLRRLAVDTARLGWWHYDPASDAGWADPRCTAILQLDDPRITMGQIAHRLHPQDRAALQDLAAGALAAGAQELPRHAELRVRMPDGSIRWVEVFGQRVADSALTAHGILLGTVADVTERHHAAEALLEADRRKDEFLAVLAHELRNPLGPVVNAVEILKRIGSPEPGAVRARAVIERQMQHMARLVDDLMDVSRIVHGRIELRRERCDLGPLVAEAAESYRGALESAGLRLSVELPAGPLWLEVDRTRVAQMVGNLVHNAGKFTPSGGHVDVSVQAARDAHEARIVVADDGAGIPPDLIGRLFDAFTQGPQSLARARGGLGLGLALVRGIARLHGGSVEAASDGPGRGARFEIRLPLLAAGEAAPAPQPAPGNEGEARPLDVLVIEDNPDALETLRTLLSMAGHRLRTAADGEAGLALGVERLPDALVCDIGLPGALDGIAVGRAMRAAAAGRPLRMVAVSGYGQAELRERARAAGFDAYLVKPVDPMALLAALAPRETADL